MIYKTKRIPRCLQNIENIVETMPKCCGKCAKKRQKEEEKKKE